MVIVLNDLVFGQKYNFEITLLFKILVDAQIGQLAIVSVVMTR
ncbi:hypothetical protein GLIP_0410 [Aliiglaciecola lipolytica E3]|uniref:Uncharacterized protein n=1 Tax=Aliiglaciecola lipolytica E3 TaxID=1127673 RepID=K6Y465_9ALTE|nr:hypothetical protein GLIP_0410 [Aliiglaciecola lipolytica E3]